MLALQTIICSTRPGRVGPAVARWFHGVAAAHGGFAATLVDLADFDLPLYDEAHHPMTGIYEREHTKRWSASVAAADAYAFVTPEYDYGPPPSFVNALVYLAAEWNGKACGFVSYGGVSGGLRAVQMEKLTVTALSMMPVSPGVTVPMVRQSIADGELVPNDHLAKSATIMLDELARWAGALKTMRG